MEPAQSLPTKLGYASRDRLSSTIEGKLAERERQRRALLMLKLLIAVPASLIGPFAVAAFVAPLFDDWLSLTFVASFILTLVIIFWRAIEHRTDYFGEAIADAGVTSSTDVYRTNSYGEWEMRHTWLSLGAYLEIIFWGPYLVLDAIAAWRADANVQLICRTRAIQVLSDLLASAEGMPISQLRQPGEQAGALAGALAYLKQHEWIDLSERRDRVWLASEAREQLAAPSVV